MPVDHAAAWEGLDEHTARQAERDEARVRRGFWSKAKRVAARLPFAEDLLSAYYCAFDRTTPIQVNAAVLATALRLVASHIRPEHRKAARQALARGLDG